LPEEALCQGAVGRASLARVARPARMGAHAPLRRHRAHDHHLRSAARGRLMKRRREIVALYPGSFDPITRGHEELARRALGVADRLIVAVAYNSTHDKKGFFTIEERVDLIAEVFADEERIEVKSFQGLLVDFARSEGA